MKPIPMQPNMPVATNCFGNPVPPKQWYTCPHCNKSSPLSHEAEGLTDEVVKLRGQMGVLVGLLGAALQVIQTVDGDDVDECQMLMDLQNKITYAIRGACGIKGDA
jgi:hypothetical protein